jgi:hypothetical protein
MLESPLVTEKQLNKYSLLNNFRQVQDYFNLQSNLNKIVDDYIVKMNKL